MANSAVLRVLLVEDNPADARLIDSMLREAEDITTGRRFELIRAADLAAGLEQLATADIQIVLLNLSLPDSQGLATFTAMHARATQIPIVVLTGLADQASALGAVHQGAQDHLVKGQLDPHSLARAIRYAVERNRMLTRLDRNARELEAGEARLRSIIEQNADGMAIVDRNHVVRFVNAAAEGLFGRPRAELLGEAFPLAASVGAPAEVALTRPGREPAVVELRAAALDWEGEPTTLMSLRDVTERKRLEERLRQSEKMEMIAKLAGGVAHDFNNLLTAIVGYASFAHNEVMPNSPAALDIEYVLQAADRAAGLARRLLAFARRQIIFPRAMDLSAFVAGMGGRLQAALPPAVEYVTELAMDLGPTQADPAQIEQVVMGLVTNARDAMLAGGRLTLRTGNVTLETESVRGHLETAPGDYVLLSISDTGSGMSDEVKAHLFEPFFTTKGVGEGEGLGLAMVYGIVKQHRGDIWVDSTPGQGTTFTILLPRSDVKAAALAAGAQDSAVSAYRPTVLVAEDEPTVRELTARMLTQLGYDVEATADGREALERAAGRERIDVLLTDLELPHMSGQALARRLRGLQPDLKVVFFSGLPAELRELEGAALFLQKPFSRDALAAKLKEALGE
jgi:two-component system, cell cycle sensor histidine kinase and response regulator CckA